LYGVKLAVFRILGATVYNDPISQRLINTTSKEQLGSLISILVLAILRLIPAAISGGIGSEVQRPLATVIIGRLTSTLIFASVLLPPLYWWTNKNGNRNKQKE
jgi:cobalt-zinc-cadmium resistance protein CzcA